MALLLPPYPSTQTRKSLPPLQAASFYDTVLNALHATLALPPAKLQLPTSANFVASYAQDAAQQKLHSLIWETELKLSPNELRIRKLALQLAENLASSAGPTAQRHGIDLQVLISLAIAFARTHVNRIRSIVHAASRTNIQLVQDVEKELVPSFVDLLLVNKTSPSHGLYAVRKTAYSLLCFLRVSPPDLIRPFAYNKEFTLALANMYNDGLIAIATGYGGINVLRSAIAADPNAMSRAPDDWERIWVSTKVALVDTFHTILTCLLDDLASSSKRQLSTASERMLGVVFALLELRPSTFSGQIPPTPFLNLPLLADYQQTYNLSDTLMAALRRAEEWDPRLDLLESTLQALGKQPANNQPKNPGALTILLRSSGLPQKVHHKPTADSRGDYNGGSSKAITVGSAMVTNPGPELDIKVTQVLDIFPSHSPSYVRLLLEWPAFSGNEEKVIEALLEDTAPSESELFSASGSTANLSTSTSTAPSTSEDDIARMVRERRNVFDDEIIDLSQLRMGKKSEDSQALLGGRANIERMKVDILRRVQEMQLEEDEEFEIQGAGSVSRKGKEKATVAIENDDDELDSLGRVKVVGDGESDDESDKASDEEEEEEAEGKSPSPETVLELAYLRDPKLFDRDAATRRSKARTELKAQTGWADEQIEGWKIMLERNPKKDKILQKYELSGNQNWLPPRDATPVPSGSNSSEGNRGRGHSRGGSRGRGRGGGRGGGGEPRGGGPQSAAGAKGRDYKERHKAGRANHNRKKGHDRKIARAGAGPSTA